MSDSARAIVLIGAPGAGKTRAGKRVARILGMPFVDTDKHIVAEHGPIATIFDEFGEPHFRRIERAVVAEALRAGGVVTLGAGAVLDPDTQADLAAHTVIQLVVSAEAVSDRIADGKRPLLRGGVGAWEALIAARKPVYDTLADYTVDTSNLPPARVAAKIVAVLRKDSS